MASRATTAKPRPVYALRRLRFTAGAIVPPSMSVEDAMRLENVPVFEPGDELQDHVPADILAACVQDGRAGYDNPGNGER